jgi:signal transduction histidine kinase
MDGYAYDWMFRIQPPAAHPPRSAVVAFDERSLQATGGVRNLRSTLAAALDRIRTAAPRAIAIDIVLSDPGDPDQDKALAQALRQTRNVILASDLLPRAGGWEDPLPEFSVHARAVGHVHAAPDPVSRVLPLEHAGGRDRRWAMALEAFRIVEGKALITESPEAIQVGDARIPGTRETARALYIRYREGIPGVPVSAVLKDGSALDILRDKAVFIGVTAQTAARDRLMTPLRDQMMSGVEIHAQAFETLMDGTFIEPAGDLAGLLLCALLVISAGIAFAYFSGWTAYAMGGLVLTVAHTMPHLAFSRGVIVPYMATVWSAWLAVVSAAAWQYFVVRRQLRKTESEKARYQQAIHFVTHEMRSPLTAIQGSSELMGRYNLNEEKRKQIAQTINSESKRLARMIETFLDVERLSDGQMEMRSEEFSLREVLHACIERARPLAERKQIRIQPAELEEAGHRGDRELMEYAVYNLLTNAIKYSPAETVVAVELCRDGSNVRLSVRDQGIGMDAKELRNIFTKFYRTKKAEASGETGTGIGLSIVEQIVAHHGGRMEVTSAPGQGSCFTMVLPAVNVARLVSQ